MVRADVPSQASSGLLVGVLEGREGLGACHCGLKQATDCHGSLEIRTPWPSSAQGKLSLQSWPFSFPPFHSLLGPAWVLMGNP